MVSLFAKKDYEIPDGGISEVGKLAIGGIDQFILIQSYNANHPVLLFLHGGPGLPVPGVSNRSRDYALATATKELVKHCTVVFWDQRGAGKSYRRDIPQDSYNIAQYVSDARELVAYLKQRFAKRKIFLAGHSWGSVPGLRLVHESPGDFHAYVGISQIVDWAENDRLCLRWLLDQASASNNRKALRELAAIGEPPYVRSVEQWTTLRKWLAKYNAMIHSDANVKHPGMKLPLGIVLRSPDYSLRDLLHLLRGFQASYTQRMIEDFARIDLARTIRDLPVPVCFIHGARDRQVYGELVEAYARQLRTPGGVRLHWMDNSSHLFHPDDAGKIERILIDLVLTK